MPPGEGKELWQVLGHALTVGKLLAETLWFSRQAARDFTVVHLSSRCLLLGQEIVLHRVLLGT